VQSEVAPFDHDELECAVGKRRDSDAH
jgi:hypothetical protein